MKLIDYIEAQLRHELQVNQELLQQGKTALSFSFEIVPMGGHKLIMVTDRTDGKPVTYNILEHEDGSCSEGCFPITDEASFHQWFNYTFYLY